MCDNYGVITSNSGIYYQNTNACKKLRKGTFSLLYLLNRFGKIIIFCNLAKI